MGDGICISPFLTRFNGEELITDAKIDAEKLNKAKDPVKFFILFRAGFPLMEKALRCMRQKKTRRLSGHLKGT